VNELYPGFWFSSVLAVANALCEKEFRGHIFEAVAPMLGGDELQIFSAVNILAATIGDCPSEAFNLADFLSTVIVSLLNGQSWLLVIAGLNFVASLPNWVCEIDLTNCHERIVQFVRGFLVEPIGYGDIINAIVRYMAVLAFAQLVKLQAFPPGISHRRSRKS
jgi:hypothetical protein